MYWFTLRPKHIVPLEKVIPCTLADDLEMPPHTITYYETYKKVSYQSPDYKTMGEMLTAFHDVTQLTRQCHIISFYKDGRYIGEGDQLYKLYNA